MDKLALTYPTATMEEKLDFFYDWFCSDAGRVARIKKYDSFTTAVINHFAPRFKNQCLFFKQNPGWHGNVDTDTLLIQLYEADYPRGSQRICLSICRCRHKALIHGSNYTMEYQVHMWKEGSDFDDNKDMWFDLKSFRKWVLSL